MERIDLIPYVMKYYEVCLGYCPDTDCLPETLKTVWYLKINGLSDQQIYQELFSHHTEIVTVADLSEALWTNLVPRNLVQKGHYYFHRELQIIAPSPSFSLRTGETQAEDWCVPKMFFTTDDLTTYFFSRLSKQEQELCLGYDYEKTARYLLTRFRDCYPDIEPLDFLLCLIDEFARDDNKRNIKGLISVTDYIQNILGTYRGSVSEAKARGYDKPRWPVCF